MSVFCPTPPFAIARLTLQVYSLLYAPFFTSLFVSTTLLLGEGHYDMFPINCKAPKWRECGGKWCQIVRMHACTHVRARQADPFRDRLGAVSGCLLYV